jgi:GT2 family glycosyltransferase
MHSDGKNLVSAVAVPVRDEATRLPKLLNALANQTAASSVKPLGVVLVLNNCVDNSIEIVRTAAAKFINLVLKPIEIRFPKGAAHVGSARRLAMDEALEMVGSEGVLLSTDADATPTPHWVEANLGAIAAGADIVGGHIIGNKEEEALLGARFVRRAARQLYYMRLVDRLTALIDPVPHDPWPRHSDHTGASLAVRAAVYQAVGGLPPLRFREDVAFVANVCRAGYRLRHPPEVQVVVSARLDGRAEGGMADCIKRWRWAAQRQLPHLVEDPALIALRLARTRHRPGSEASSVRVRIQPTVSRSRSLEIRNIAVQPIDIEAAIARIEHIISGMGESTHVA